MAGAHLLDLAGALQVLEGDRVGGAACIVLGVDRPFTGREEAHTCWTWREQSRCLKVTA